MGGVWNIVEIFFSKIFLTPNLNNISKRNIFLKNIPHSKSQQYFKEKYFSQKYFQLQISTIFQREIFFSTIFQQYFTLQISTIFQREIFFSKIFLTPNINNISKRNIFLKNISNSKYQQYFKEKYFFSQKYF